MSNWNSEYLFAQSIGIAYGVLQGQWVGGMKPKTWLGDFRKRKIPTLTKH